MPRKCVRHICSNDWSEMTPDKTSKKNSSTGTFDIQNLKTSKDSMRAMTETTATNRHDENESVPK